MTTITITKAADRRGWYYIMSTDLLEEFYRTYEGRCSPQVAVKARTKEQAKTVFEGMLRNRIIKKVYLYP